MHDVDDARRDARFLAGVATIASAVSGVSVAGLSTTVQPAASAGPILRVAIAAGKFHGVTSTADADRLPQHDNLVGAARRRLHRSCAADGLLGVPAEELRGVATSARASASALPFSRTMSSARLFTPLRHQRERSHQHVAAVARGLCRPRVERFRGRVHRGQRVLGARVGDLCDALLRSPDPTTSMRSGREPGRQAPPMWRSVGTESVRSSTLIDM